MADVTNPKDMLGIKKIPIGDIPGTFLVYTALGLWNGMVKYFRFNWRSKKVIGSIYLNAAARHIEAVKDGEWLSRDAKIPHLAHACACLAIYIDAYETGNLVDDRALSGKVSDLMDYWTKEISDNLMPEWEAERDRLIAKMGKTFEELVTENKAALSGASV